MGPPRLRLFGVIHVDRVGKVTGELDAYADSVDALFIEQPEVDVTARTLARCLLGVPAFFFGWALLVLFLTPLYAVLHRAMAEAEKIAVRRVAERHDLPVHAIDDHPVVAMSRAGPRWWLANWAALAVVAALDVVAFAVTAAALVGGVTALVAVHRWSRRAWLAVAVPASWGLLAALGWAGAISPALLLASALVFLATMMTTLDHRNDHMLERIAGIADDEGYEEACLVTGKAHLSGLIALADEFGLAVTHSKPSKWLRRADNVRVDPDPDDGDWADSAGRAMSVGWPTAPEPAMGTEGGLAGRRMVAAVVDFVVLAVLVPSVAVLVGVCAGAVFGDGALEPAIEAGLLGVPLLYHPLFEYRLGRTPGKRLLGLVVVRSDGSSPSFVRALVRHVARPFEVLLFGVGLAAMVVSERARRLGDRLAGTVVVRTAGSVDDGETTDATRAAKDLSADRPSSRS